MAMLSMEGGKEATTNELLVKDIDSATMDKLLRYIYTGAVEEPVDFAFLKACDRYEVDGLMVCFKIGFFISLRVEQFANGGACPLCPDDDKRV